MLMPKRTKWRKQQRGRIRGEAGRGNEVAFGEFGLQSLEPGWVFRGGHPEEFPPLPFQAVAPSPTGEWVAVQIDPGLRLWPTTPSEEARTNLRPCSYGPYVVSKALTTSSTTASRMSAKRSRRDLEVPTWCSTRWVATYSTSRFAAPIAMAA